MRELLAAEVPCIAGGDQFGDAMIARGEDNTQFGRDFARENPGHLGGTIGAAFNFAGVVLIGLGTAWNDGPGSPSSGGGSGGSGGGGAYPGGSGQGSGGSNPHSGSYYPGGAPPAPAYGQVGPFTPCDGDCDSGGDEGDVRSPN